MPGDAGVEHALLDVARHLLGADQDALDLGIVDVRVVGALRDAQLEARLREEPLRRLLQVPLRQPQPQPSRGAAAHRP